MKVIDALPTITSQEELDGFLQAGVDMGFNYTIAELSAIALKKIELTKESKQTVRRHTRFRSISM